MKLKSMKTTKADRTAREKQYSDPLVEQDTYPYGLTLRLDEETIAKLDIGELPDVEVVLDLVAKVRVTSVSSNQTTGGGTRRSLELQITEMALAAPAKASAEKLYGG